MLPLSQSSGYAVLAMSCHERAHVPQIDALRRALRHAEVIPAVVVVVDPKDLAAVAFYKRNGFQPLDERRMFVSMAELKQWEAQGWKS